VAEPANAYTSLTKTLVGIAILWSGRKHRDVLLIIGVAAFFQGFFGFALHATGAFWGEALDVSGMFTLIGLFIAFAARRLWHWSSLKVVGCFVALLLTSVALLLRFRPMGIALFTIQVVLWVALEVQLFRSQGKTIDYRFLRLLVLTFAVAFAVWGLDFTRLVCDPDNHIFNLHSAWHVLTSLCIYWFYRHQQQFRESAPAAE